MISEERWRAEGIERQYYIWLTNWIPEWRASYGLLIWRLYETPFRVTLLMDENRVSDGLSLRTRFIYETGRNSGEREILKAVRPCSILEVMIGLAIRFEEEYMTASSEENPVGKWFGVMLTSLGLGTVRDDIFIRESDRVNMALEAFLDRAYFANGRGGLFYIPELGLDQDMRQIELWRQIMIWHTYKQKGGIVK